MNKPGLAGASLNAIGQALRNLNGLNASIASATLQQAHVVEDINQNVTQAAGLSHSTAMAAEQSSVASVQLAPVERTTRTASCASSASDPSNCGEPTPHPALSPRRGGRPRCLRLYVDLKNRVDYGFNAERSGRRISNIQLGQSPLPTGSRVSEGVCGLANAVQSAPFFHSPKEPPCPGLNCLPPPSV